MLAAHIAHRVSLPSADDSSPHAAAAFWYPLATLARWSGVVPAGAQAPLVKRAMAEAKAALQHNGRASSRPLDQVYNKIGNVVSVANNEQTRDACRDSTPALNSQGSHSCLSLPRCVAALQLRV